MSSFRLCRGSIATLLTTSFIAAFAVTGLSASSPAMAAAPPPPTFTASNAGTQTWTVPDGIYVLTLTAAGGSGSDGSTGSTGAGGGAGGKGGTVVETIDVVPGDVLQVLPGGSGDHPTYGEAAFAGGYPSYYANAGGQGGGATTVRLNGNLVAIAGGGGGGGGGSRLAGSGWHGGPGGAGGGYWGTAGDGYVAGQSGHGPRAGTGVGDQGGAEAAYSPAGGGGGGGGGYDLNSGLGGGNGGFGGNFPGGGGGGGAGGSSWGATGPTYGVADVYGDGFVSIRVRPRQLIVAAANPAPSGAPTTMTDTLSSIIPGGPLPTGTVTWYLLDVYTGLTSNVTTVAIVNGQSSWTLPAGLPVGTAYVLATYNGDSNYMALASGGYAEGISADQHAWSIVPDTSGNFGTVALGFSATRTFTVTNYGNTTDTPGLSAADSHFQITSNNCAAVAPGQTCSVEVTFSSTTKGTLSGAVYVSTPGLTIVKTGLTATADSADFTVGTSSVSFGSIYVGGIAKGVVDVVNGHVQQTFSASVDGTAFSVVREGCDNVAAGAHCKLWVYYRPTSAGMDTATMYITSSYGTASTLAITATAMPVDNSIGGPSVSVGPSPLSFGPTLLGLRTTRTVTVKNTSTASAQVSSAVFDSPSMSVPSLGTCALVIAPFGNCTFDAVFTPSVAGAVDTQLRVSLVTGPVATAPASGSGVKAAPTISAVSPATGPAAGGTTVTITGSNLQPATSVLFGTRRVAATCTATGCTVVSPRGAGRVDVRVITPSGTSAVVTADRFTYR